MNYQEWERTVPAAITGDSLWKMEAYRLSLFAGDLAWEDATKLMRDRRTRGLSDQLIEPSVPSARMSGKATRAAPAGIDRAFTVMHLALAEKAAIGITKGRHVLGESVTNHRLDLMTQIIRILLVMIPDQRRESLRKVKRCMETSALANWRLSHHVSRFTRHS